jgi:ParB family chromosome partitioning protein
MKININKINVDPRKRIRTSSGKNLEALKKSMKKIGLINPITINDQYKLLAGFRRFMAAVELGWTDIDVVIKKNLTKLEELDIEIEENLKRKDLTPYELDVALAKRKILYEKLYPETKHGAYMKKERKKGQKTLPKKSITAKSSSIDSLNLEGDRFEPPKSFAKSIVEITNSSERSIRDKIQVGKAILNKEYDEKTIELFKEGKISHSKMLEKTKEIKKCKKQKRQIKEENKSDKKKCIDCSKARASACPHCGEMILICDKGYYILRKSDAEACEDGDFSIE